MALLASSCFFSFCIPVRLWTYDAPEAAFPGFTGCRPVPHPKLVSSCEASSCDPWYDHSINTSLCFHPRIQEAAPLGVNSDIPGRSYSKSCLVFTVHTVQMTPWSCTSSTLLSSTWFWYCVEGRDAHENRKQRLVFRSLRSWHSDLSASICRVLGLQVCATTSLIFSLIYDIWVKSKSVLYLFTLLQRFEGCLAPVQQK